MNRVLPVALLTTCALAAAAPQSQTAEIQGRVINAATRQPIRGAVVSVADPVMRAATDPASAPPDRPPLTESLPGSRRFLTDNEGRFTLRGISAGAATLWSQKHGYFIGASGRRRPNGISVPLVVAGGDRITGVELLMWPMGSISGSVTDERGAPLSGVSVVVSRRLDDPGNGSRETGPVAGTARSDDLGRYTVGGLGAGEYLAGVTVRQTAVAAGSPLLPQRETMDLAFETNMLGTGVAVAVSGIPLFSSAPPHVIAGGKRFAYSGTFYGGASDPSAATVIALQDGDERIGVDLRLEPQPTVRIAGTVTDGSAPIGLVNLELSSGSVTASAATSATGSFVFEIVPSGIYVLKARRPSSNAAPLPIERDMPAVLPPFVANRDIENLTVTLGGGPTVSGTVVVPSGVDVDRVRVRLLHAGSSAITATVATVRGSFAFVAVPPGRYLLRSESDMADAIVESVELRGRNITDVPLEVSTTDVGGLVLHVTNRPAIVSGTVQRADGKPPVHAAVALFPADASTWSAPLLPNSRQFQTRRVSGGGYLFENVPRGDYYLAAVDDAVLRQWHDRSLLQRLIPQAVRITVTPGAEVQRDLTVEER